MAANTTIRSKYGQPALIGGVAMGVLSALPLISAVNACCCLWVVSGGLVAAYLLQQNQSLPITAADGALVGLFAGIIGAFVTLFLSIPIGLLIEPMQRAMAQHVLDMSGTMPPFVQDILQRQANPREIGLAGRMALHLVSFFFLLSVGSVFATLGGLLGSTLFKRDSGLKAQGSGL